MKKFIFIRGAILLPMIFQAVSAVAGINFKSVSFEEAKKIAEKENKLVFIDAYATWCGPCKWLSANVFTDEEVGKVFDKTFVSIKIDMETDPGFEIDELFNVTAYPTLLAVRPDGSLVRKQVGALESEELIEWVDICLHPENAPYQIHKTKYENGLRDLDFLIDYLAISIDEEQQYDFLIPEIYKVMPDDALEDEKNMLIFTYFPPSISDPRSLYFFEHFNHLKDMHGEITNDALWATIEHALQSEEKTKSELTDLVSSILKEENVLLNELKSKINEF